MIYNYEKINMNTRPDFNRSKTTNRPEIQLFTLNYIPQVTIDCCFSKLSLFKSYRYF